MTITKNPQTTSVLRALTIMIGKTKTSSTSNTTKITAYTKNRRDIGARVSFLLLNPHSKGDINSRPSDRCLAKSAPAIKKTRLITSDLLKSINQK